MFGAASRGHAAEGGGEQSVKLTATDRLGETAEKALHGGAPAQRSHHDELQSGDFGVCFDSADERLPVHSGHLHVNKDRVIRDTFPGRPPQLGEGLGAARRLGRRASPAPKQRHCQEAVGPVVVHDEDPCIVCVKGLRGRRLRRLTLLEGDGEPEARSATYSAFYADLSSHELDELLRDRKTGPVPPYFRVVEPSTCVKGRKRARSLSRGMPMPVSRTSKRSLASLGRRRREIRARRSRPCR